MNPQNVQLFKQLTFSYCNNPADFAMWRVNVSVHAFRQSSRGRYLDILLVKTRRRRFGSRALADTDRPCRQPQMRRPWQSSVSTRSDSATDPPRRPLPVVGYRWGHAGSADERNAEVDRAVNGHAEWLASTSTTTQTLPAYLLTCQLGVGVAEGESSWSTQLFLQYHASPSSLFQFLTYNLPHHARLTPLHVSSSTAFTWVIIVSDTKVETIHMSYMHTAWLHACWKYIIHLNFLRVSVRDVSVCRGVGPVSTIFMLTS